MATVVVALHAVLALSSSLAAVAFVPDATYTFDDFVQDFGRSYKLGSEEYVQRKLIFETRLQSILTHNRDTSKTWVRGINEYADLTQAEFEASGRLGYNKALGRHYASQHSLTFKDTRANTTLDGTTLPKSVDWRQKGVVSDVKDQGHCGSCWAFGTTETVESYAAIASGKLLTLSPQQLASCAPNPLSCGGVGGCQGSIPEVAYDYIQLFGMVTEWMMPYTSYYGENAACKLNVSKNQVSVQISGYQKLPPNDQAAVMRHLAEVGPLAINVDASTWHDYEDGIFDGCNKTNVDIDHVVQLVGYGSDAKLGDYWLVRNSWDATWGANGYIKLKRDASPKCGVDHSPLDGTGCSGGPATQHVCGTCGMLFDTSYPLGAKMIVHGHHSIMI